MRKFAIARKSETFFQTKEITALILLLFTPSLHSIPSLHNSFLPANNAHQNENINCLLQMMNRVVILKLPSPLKRAMSAISMPLIRGTGLPQNKPPSNSQKVLPLIVCHPGINAQHLLSIEGCKLVSAKRRRGVDD